MVIKPLAVSKIKTSRHHEYIVGKKIRYEIYHACQDDQYLNMREQVIHNSSTVSANFFLPSETWNWPWNRPLCAK